MLVAHQQDYDTHAIIGGSDVMEFGVAQTAEFFEVLSSTLYSDKPLAVVREVTCNAWDSHKASGIRDIPIKVTIDDTRLVIRDFGKGIAHNMMQPIYCVYGNSTKANDGNQTGGFGLGSKAPFAYSTHFTVTSFHEGFRTVYAISRGSAKTNGKPDCRVMVKVPTTESGLEVSIPLKNPVDGHDFERILRTLVQLGEMNVELNGVKLKVLPISKATEGFYLTTINFSKHQERIYVRYGDVVYPVPQHEEYDTAYSALINFMDKIPENGSRNSRNWKVIFQAPANKISVTPSRESLSMTDTTIATLKELFKKLPILGSKEFIEISQDMVKQSIEESWRNFTHYQMLSFESLFPRNYEVITEITTYRQAVEQMLKYSYPSEWEFRKNDIIKRVRSLIDGGVRHKHLLLQFLKELNAADGDFFKRKATIQWSNFVSRNITGAILKKVINSDLVDKKNLYVVAAGESWSSRGPVYTPADKFKGEFHHVGELLKNTIVITHSRVSVTDYIATNPAVKNCYGKSKVQLVYVAPRNKTSGGAALEFFTKLGMNVIDHIAYVDTLAPTPTLVQSVYKEPPKPKVIGIPSLKNLLKDRMGFNVRGHLVENPERIENPEFVFQPACLKGASYNHKFFEFKDNIGALMVKHFGHLGGIVVNSKQMESYIKKGSKDGYIWLAERLLEEFQTNDRLMKYISFQLAPWHENDSSLWTIRKLHQVAQYSPNINKDLKFPEKLTSDDRDFLTIWKHIRPNKKDGTYDYYHRNQPPEQMKPLVKDIHKFIEEYPIDPQLTVIQNLVTNSELFRLVDFDEMSTILSNEKATPKQRDNVETLLLLALQG